MGLFTIHEMSRKTTMYKNTQILLKCTKKISYTNITKNTQLYMHTIPIYTNGNPHITPHLKAKFPHELILTEQCTYYTTNTTYLGYLQDKIPASKSHSIQLIHDTSFTIYKKHREYDTPFTLMSAATFTNISINTSRQFT